MNDETAHSGSRWEPTTPSSVRPEDRSTVSVAEAPRVSTADPVAPVPAARRRTRGRVVTATVAGAALLLIGGAGGYAIGQATATGSTTAGTTGPGNGGFGGRGMPGGFGGSGGGFPGGPGGTTPGTNGTDTGGAATNGTGTGATATGTGTGST